MKDADLSITDYRECTDISLEEKRALLAQKLSSNSFYPLSHAQQRQWILWQMDPQSPAYNIPAAVKIKGVLDPCCVESSFNYLITRHETLRTRFTTLNRQPVQQILHRLTLKVPITDLRGKTIDESNSLIQDIANKEAARPFDLNKCPLLRVRVLICDDESTTLLLTMHHIIADGWSLNILISEFFHIYKALSNNRKPILPDLPIQYIDFTHWQNNQEFSEQLEYWQQQLSDIPPQLSMPIDHRRPEEIGVEGATINFVFDKTLLNNLESFATRHSLTLYTLLLACFKLLLYRYTSQDDILVGTPVANRNRSEIEGLIGIFTNTLTIRSQLHDELDFLSLVKIVAKTTAEAIDHQDIPFERVIKAVELEREISHSPLFQVMFSYFEDLVSNTNDIEFHLLDIDNGTAKFEITLSIARSSLGLGGFIQYSTHLYTKETILRFLEHYRLLLQAVIKDPKLNILDYSIVTESDWNYLESQNTIKEANNVKSVDRQKSLHTLFEHQVEQNPEYTALIYENESLSYDQLNQSANQLAHYLTLQGVGPDVLVGLCVKRSFDMIIGILGILKAGGAYVPLDPAYPQDRLNFLIEDSGINLVVTQSDLLDRIPGYDIDKLCLDSDWTKHIAEQPKHNLQTPTGNDNLAYVIYTSGSTGKPKGVMVTHNNVVRLLSETQSNFHFSAQDVWALFHSYSFDFSVWEIWGALANGGRLVIIPFMTSRSPEQFYELLLEYKVTVLNQTPSAFYQLMQVDQNQRQKLSLRWVIFGGEALDLNRLKTWFVDHGDQQPVLVNMYGITETTVHVTYRVLKISDLEQPYNSPIGTAIADLHVYILDKKLRPVPIGIPGELYVGGAGVARGYLNRPTLDAERFIPNPYVHNGRIYKTGDLARILNNGEIEYLGRIDQQVKIRGFRIELGEIESTLNQHPAICDSVVTVQNNQRLIAYYTIKNDTTLGNPRTFLEKHLPGYMIPAGYVQLNKIPLTEHGKIDYRALPTDNISYQKDNKFPAEASTNNEIQLVKIWCEILGQDNIGIHDNFFALGGDSILAIQIIAKANEVGLKLTPKQLFKYPTIADLAVTANDHPKISAQQSAVTGDVPLTPIQTWFFDQQLSNPQHYNQAIVAEVQKPLNLTSLTTIIHTLINHHDALRMRFEQSTKNRSGFRQFNLSNDDSVSISQADLSQMSKTRQKEQMIRAADDAHKSLDLHHGPLIKIILFNLGDYRNKQLFIVIHHLIIDGVSWRIFLSDFELAYRQLDKGQKICLPSKTSSYKDWADHLMEYAGNEIVVNEKEYWLNELSSSGFTLPLDYNSNLSDNTQNSAEIVTCTLGVDVTSALLHEISGIYHTQINDVLLAALCVTFADSLHGLYIDLEAHGREPLFDDLDLSRTIGWFTTIYPVHLDNTSAKDIGSVIKLVKEKLRSIPHKGIHFGLLQSFDYEETLQGKNRPQICFNYLGRLDSTYQGLFSRVEKGYGTAQSLNNKRHHVLSINAYIVRDKLHIDWEYSNKLHKNETIEQYVQSYQTVLMDIIKHCQMKDGEEYTPSDFPLAKLDSNSLSNLSKLLTEMEQG